MVRNLMKAGFELHIYARTKAKVEDVISEGAIFHESIGECVSECDAVITIVGFPQDVEEVYFDEENILDCASKGAYLIDMTTTSPQIAEKIYAEGTKRGFHVLDAPVTGGDTGAKAGTLSILVGGDKEDFEACMPLFEAMGTNINYQGEAGKGQHCKLANQIMIAGTLSGVCEALTYAKEQGIQIIGDIPIYVAFDSADAWAAPELFQFDEENNPIRVAGCPPDAFAKTGQLWGNPLYNWEYHQKTGYAWWIQRIRYCFQHYDVVRIDHFRGFDEYYAIPYGESTAENGTWMPGPGMKLFQAIEKELGRPEIIAEDLGFLTESVLQMLKESGFPGMKVLQFAFDPSGESVYLPHRYSENCVVYTGTHDNDTTRGWYRTLDKESRDFAKEYMGVSRLDDDTLTWDFMRLAMGSAAQLCVTPIQDILGIDGSGRINMPSTLGGNWTWQMEKGAFDKKIVHKLYRMTQLYGRLNEQIKKQPEPGMENLKCKEKRVGKNKKLRKE